MGKDKLISSSFSEFLRVRPQLDLSNCNCVMTECLLLGADGSTHDQKQSCLRVITCHEGLINHFEGTEICCGCTGKRS